MIAMVGLGKLILQQHPDDFSVIILVTTMSPLDTSTTSSCIQDQQSQQTNLPFSFFALPSLHHAPPQSAAGDRIVAVFEYMRLNAQNVVDALETISLTSTVLAFITSVAHDTYHSHIPTYYYFTSCASTLAFFLHLPTIHNHTSGSFKDLSNTLFLFPGLPPIKASDVPDPIL